MRRNLDGWNFEIFSRMEAEIRGKAVVFSYWRTFFYYWPIGTKTTWFVAHAWGLHSVKFQDIPSKGSQFSEPKLHGLLRMHGDCIMWNFRTFPRKEAGSQNQNYMVCCACVGIVLCEISGHSLERKPVLRTKTTWFVAHAWGLHCVKFQDIPSKGSRFSEEKPFNN